MTDTPEDGDQDDLFGRLADGELDLQSPEVRARLARDPAFAAEVAHLLTIDAELAALRKPIDLAAIAASAEPWPGADAAVRALVDRELQPVPRHGTARRWWLPVLLAAAVVAVAVLLLDRGRDRATAPPTAPADLVLGPKGLWPRGEQARADFLVRGVDWSEMKPPVGATFEVTVRGPEGPPWQSGPVRTTSWLPPADVIAAMPARLHIEVEMQTKGRSPVRWTTDAWLH